LAYKKMGIPSYYRNKNGLAICSYKSDAYVI
jgi:hypothetical protein